MRTAVVLSFRAMGAFRSDLLTAPEDLRLVLVVSTAEWANVPETARDMWHDVHVVPCGVPGGGALLSSAVDPDAARTALARIVADAEMGSVTLHCFDELSMEFAAELRAQFDLPGPRPADILPFRDKHEMKWRLAGTGVRVPRWGLFDIGTDRTRPGFGAIVAEVGLPFILKPIDSAGSHGVHLIRDEAGFDFAAAGITTGYEYEEYVIGTMYSVNLVSRGRRVVFGGVTEYLVNTLDVRGGRVNADINLAHDDPRVARMVEFSTTAMAALGWPDGAAHLELFHTDADELVFLEVGARFKGLAGLAAMQRNYGVAFVNLALEIEAGVPSAPWPDEQVFCFDAVIPKRTGVVAELHDPQLESDVELTWRVAPGDVLENSDSLFTPAGTFLVSNKDYDVLYRDFYRLAEYRPLSYAKDPR